MDDIVIEVKTATQVPAFIPFTALPVAFKGRRVKLVLVDDDTLVLTPPESDHG